MDLTGVLYLYASDPDLPLFESGQVDGTKTLLFVGGLGDGPGSIPYVAPLSERLKPLGWSIAQVTLSSSYAGYGTCSLERDAREMSKAVHFLKTKRGKRDVVLMGHSTGSQDVVHYLQPPSSPLNVRSNVLGAIAQAPVSDREAFDVVRDDDAGKWTAQAERLVKQGRGRELLPREAHSAPITAARFYSLFCKGGDDDLFSSDLHSFPWASRSAAPLCMIMSGDDEYVPKHVNKDRLLARWRMEGGSENRIRMAEIIDGADHRCGGEEQIKRLCDVVERFLKQVAP